MNAFKISAAALLVSASAVLADVSTWTGAEDTLWTTAGNWTGVVPGSSDTAEFSGPVTANQPEIPGGRGLATLDFQSAGWTVGGDAVTVSFQTVTAVTSAGAGVNTFDPDFIDQYVAGMTLQAGADNTLVMNGDYTMRRNWATAGAGTIVINGEKLGSDQTWTLGEGTTLFNSSNLVGLGRDSTVAAGGTLGGTTPIFRMTAYSSMTLADGAHFSPGGNGLFGDLISTATLKSTSSTTRAYFNMGGAASKLIMDIGDTLGDNDQIVVDLSASNGYFRLNGCELALRGGSVLADGDYTLVSEVTGNYDGTFGAITYNGIAVDPANFAVTYNPDSIVLTVKDVPEPATLGLLALGGLGLLRRRRTA